MDGAVGVGKRYGNGVCGIGVKILGIEDAVELKNGSSRDLQRASKKLRFLFDCLCIALPVRNLIEDGFGAIAEGEGIVGRIEMNVSRDMRRASFNHLQTLSFSYFNQNSVGYIHSRVMSDTGRIGGLVSWSLMDGVWNVTYMLGASVVMLIINWKMALMVLIIVPLAALASVYFQKHLIRLPA